MDDLTGKLLIAVPQLPDENFFRSVVLILRHDDEGALGVILNRPSGVTISQAWESLFDQTLDSREPIFIGGPVDGPLIGLSSRLATAEAGVIPGIYFSINQEHLDELATKNQPPFRIFMGHSGWGPGQLELEIEFGSWYIVEATAELIFESDDSVWKDLLDQFGREVLSLTKVSSPGQVDPLMN
ncbi:MAG TPA: YqgE/AlgH family protein [Pirellulaceae bacterium]|nr:YqgE/AlgH family protein [Pirellulaceae bacterium]HMO91805.1 YqgE/AlgH family protein [Pirellulaceae bacterium]HMP69868.1 YqgE/AlgH family protein [Pirellulaceae bacterium]